MKIILVMLNNFQEYIYDQIDHLFKYGNTDIDLITDSRMFERFTRYANTGLKLHAIEELDPNYLELVAQQESTFRRGFWFFAKYRFVAIQLLMKSLDLRNILHLENDVLFYEQADRLVFHSTEKILLVKINDSLCIPSLMVIPNSDILERCLSQFTERLNDMEDFGRLNTTDIDLLPIIHSPHLFSNNFEHYQAIFDGAAIGQSLNGVDPIHGPSYGSSYINPNCVIKYNQFSFRWKNGRPYLVTETKDEIPVLCIHVHSKNLALFANHPDALINFKS